MACPPIPALRCRRRPLAGFTLIELLIVIIIIGILLAIGIPAYLTYQAKAKDTDAKNALMVAYKAAISGDSEVNNGRFPIASTIVQDIQADEPGISVARASCTTAGAAATKQVLVDPASSSSSLTLCVASASGTIWRLTGPLTGTPTVSDASTVPLAFAGGEITDTVRAAGVQGDGLTNDSSTGMWAASTNVLPNTSYENNTTGWVASTLSGDAAISQSAAHAMFGTHALKLTASAGTLNAARTTGFNYAPSTTYTVSGWFYIETLGPGVTSIYLTGVYNAPQSDATAALNLAKLGQWQYVKTTFTTDANPQTATYVDAPRISGSLTGTTVVYADGVQVEAQPAATPYIATNGVVASRVPGDVEAPASALNATQGWVAVRARLNQGLPDPHTGYWGAFFDWGENNTDSIELYLSGGQSYIAMRRIQGGVVSGAGWNSTIDSPNFPKAAGSYITVIGMWTASQIGVSVDGNVFTTISNATVPTIAATNFDIGRRLLTESLNGDIMWFACGTGTLTNSDAATINSWGNTDPKRTQFPSSAQATMTWDGTSPVGSLK